MARIRSTIHLLHHVRSQRNTFTWYAHLQGGINSGTGFRNAVGSLLALWNSVLMVTARPYEKHETQSDVHIVIPETENVSCWNCFVENGVWTNDVSLVHGWKEHVNTIKNALMNSWVELCVRLVCVRILAFLMNWWNDCYNTRNWIFDKWVSPWCAVR